MLAVYSSKTSIKFYPTRDLIGEICYKSETNDIDKALNISGYRMSLDIGEEEASIELYASNELHKSARETEFGCIALVSLGGQIETYAMATFHDALEFMKEYTPTITMIVDLLDRSELKLEERRKAK